MKKISYSSKENFFVAGKGVEDAIERAEQNRYRADTSFQAWDDVPYYYKSDDEDGYEVFEFQLTQQITKVEPPYSN